HFVMADTPVTSAPIVSPPRRRGRARQLALAVAENHCAVGRTLGGAAHAALAIAEGGGVALVEALPVIWPRSNAPAPTGKSASRRQPRARSGARACSIIQRS